MRFKQVQGASGIGDHIMANIRNDDTVVIPKGSPVILNMNLTGDGYAVVLPSTAGALKSNALAWGVAQQAIGVNLKDDVYSTGYVPFAVVQYATRSASTASWSSSASIAALAQLSIDTINNAFATVSASVGTANNPFAVLLDSIASFAASASATTDSRTALTIGARVFVRFI